MDALFNGLPDRIPLINFLNAHFIIFKMFCDKIFMIVNNEKLQVNKTTQKILKCPKKYLSLLLAFFERFIILNFPYNSKKFNE